jgi:hypothetical protein
MDVLVDVLTKNVFLLPAPLNLKDGFPQELKESIAERRKIIELNARRKANNQENQRLIGYISNRNLGINKGNRAAELSKLAKSREDWNQVIKLLEDAIIWLQKIPPTYYSQKRFQDVPDKIEEYQQQLKFAKEQAEKVGNSR